jgi:hypothetical protein
MTTQSNKAQAWLARHGITVHPSESPSVEANPAPLARQDDGRDDDWATDAQRWYLQRAQGIDVAQLLPYHQTTGK